MNEWYKIVLVGGSHVPRPLGVPENLPQVLWGQHCSLEDSDVLFSGLIGIFTDAIMKVPVGEDSGASALIKAGVPVHPGSHCVNIPHPVHLQEPPHTCHLTVLLIKQKLLNHSPRAYIFLIFCVAKGISHNVRPLHTAAWWWVWRKTSVWLLLNCKES